MKYFVVLLPMKDTEKSTVHRPKHLDYVQKMRDEGNVFMYGTLVDGAGGLIIYQGESLEQVTTLAENDPYVQLGARGLEIHEWAMKSDYTITK